MQCEEVDGVEEEDDGAVERGEDGDERGELGGGREGDVAVGGGEGARVVGGGDDERVLVGVLREGWRCFDVVVGWVQEDASVRTILASEV